MEEFYTPECSQYPRTPIISRCIAPTLWCVHISPAAAQHGRQRVHSTAASGCTARRTRSWKCIWAHPKHPGAHGRHQQSGWSHPPRGQSTSRYFRHEEQSCVCFLYTFSKKKTTSSNIPQRHLTDTDMYAVLVGMMCNTCFNIYLRVGAHLFLLTNSLHVSQILNTPTRERT